MSRPQTNEVACRAANLVEDRHQAAILPCSFEFRIPFPILYNQSMLESFVTTSSSETMECAGDQRPCWLSITTRIQHGDSQAFAEFYEQTFDVMFAHVRRVISCDEPTALDIVQTAMLKSIRLMKPLPNEASVNAWAAVVAKSVSYDWLRQKTRRREVDLNSSVSEPSSSSEKSQIDLDARLQWVESELQDLSPDLRKMISFRYRFGWSLRRIAEKFGLKTGAVDGRIRRAMEGLKSKAESEYHE